MKKQKVFRLVTSSTAPQFVIFHKIDELLQWVKDDCLSCAESYPNDAYEIKIEKIEMTDKELLELPEYDG